MVTSNYIRLTSNDRSQQGAIWNKVISKHGINVEEVNVDNLCPGAVQNEELGGAAELQGVGHHPGPLRGRVLLLVRQGPDDAGASVRVAGHVERPRHHRRHLQQPQRSVVG